MASVRSCVAETAGAPSALCLSGAMHGLLALDARDQPLAPVYTWADSQSEKQAARLKQDCDSHTLYSRTGCPIHSTYFPAKIQWLKECQPAVYKAAARFVSVKEFVIHELTGRWVIDTSLASGTGLLNIHTQDWDELALQAAEIRREHLSLLVPPTTKIDRLVSRAADDLGLPVDTSVIVGANDAALSSLGVGAVNPHVLVIMIGTSGAVRLLTDQPRLDERERTWCYVLDKTHYLVGGAINNAGIALNWFADGFVKPQDDGTYDRLIQEAAQIGPGANGLVFLPFLAGERNPGWNAKARGVLFGLSLHHGRAHVVRAILESVAYRLRSVFEAVEELTGPAVEIRASGGFLRSPLWVQILADALGRPIGVPLTRNTSAIGAALLGWHALGEMDDLQQVADMAPLTATVQPDAQVHAVYSRMYRLYGRLYHQLADEFAEISEIQASFEKTL